MRYNWPMASGEKTMSRAWVVLAVILVLFFIGIFLDQILTKLVPTYTGIFFEKGNPFTVEDSLNSTGQSQ
jgi:4-hydroxybenzoate polyprenyltransferase